MNNRQEQLLIARNTELEKELVLKNRELEIEAALDRLRSRMLRMQKSSELEETTAVMYQQMDALGIVPEGSMVYIVIIDTNTDTAIQWIVTDRTLVRPQEGELRTPLTEDPRLIKTYAAWKRKDPLLIRDLSGDELEDFKNYIKSLPSFQEVKSEVFQWPARLVWSEASFSNGTLGFICPTPLPAATLDILVRFSKDFDLTYTRFLDLQKAEAQAREAQIEAALERTRTQSMLMEHSHELDVTSQIFHEQLLLLGIPSEFSYVWLPDESKNEHQFWATWQETEDTSTVLKSKAIMYQLDKTEPYTAACFTAWESDEPVHQHPIPPEEVDHFFATWQELLDGVNTLKPELFPDGLYYGEAYMKYGCFGINVRRLLSEEEQSILRRFSTEFERTYTRFLDLQKAEAQAREAQIELGLERVRSRAMAMQNSDELNELIGRVFIELTNLDLVLTRCIIWIFDREKHSARLWMVNSEDRSNPTSLFIQYHEHPPYLAFVEGWKQRVIKWEYDLSGSDKKEWDTFLFTETEFSRLPDFVKISMQEPEQILMSASFNNFGCLQTAGLEPLSDEHFDILLRFAKVFDLTYTRFNDLKQAEAQAREAQIEAALERVRSRTMGMQKSEELKEVIQVVYNQFVHLNIHIEHTGFIMDYRARDDMHIWLADQHEVPSEVIIPYFDCAHWNSFNEAKEKGMDFFANLLSFEEKNKFYQDLFKLIPGVPEETLEYYFGYPGLAISTVLIENVGLYIENFSAIPYTDEENNTLMRFGKVFQQTYTRFLDLQKAEAQAREAQIEAALERVRARAMAMQSPDELKEVTVLLRKEMGQLGIDELETSSIYLVNEEMTECWYAIKDIRKEGTKLLSDHITLRLKDTWVGRQMEEFYHSKQKHTSIVMQGVNRKEWINYCDSKSSVFQGYYGDEIPERIYHLLKFAGGFMGAASPGGISNESWDLLQRCTSVFSMAYTRFKDLQQAAARAREAQIELALERVRARTMAMHKSEELQEMVNVVFDNLTQLQVATDTVTILIPKAGSKDIEVWIQNEDRNYSSRVLMPYIESSPIGQHFIIAWKRKSELITNHYTKEEKDHWFNHLFRHPESLQNIPEERKEYVLSGSSYSTSIIFNVHTGMYMGRYHEKPFSESENDILKRFAKVFEQTYTRFLDLKKAEAQARVAQIEAALERVRSRTMAMHQSQELAEVAVVLFNQLIALGLNIHWCWFSLVDEERKCYNSWMTSPGGDLNLINFQVPFDANHNVAYGYQQWKKKVPFLTKAWTGKAAREYLQFLEQLSGWSAFRELTLASFVNVDVCFKYGTVGCTTFKELSEEQMHILQRFAAVFEQTYTRFLDLQKAEAQTREAQIEAALEKVRSKALGMQSSDDLISITDELRFQMGLLGQPELESSIILLFNNEAESYEAWWTFLPLGDPDGQVLKGVARIPVNSSAYSRETYEKYLSDASEYIIESRGKKLHEWYKVLENVAPPTVDYDAEGKMLVPEVLYYHYCKFSGGALLMISGEKQTWEVRSLQKRAATTFEFAYRRFLDLQEAEKQAIKAVRQASLDRVRGEIASMRSPKDLQRITPLIWRELNTLGVPFFRCGVFIVDEMEEKIHVFLSTPEGSPLAAMDVPFDHSDFVRISLDHWREKKIFRDEWDKEKFKEWTNSISEQGLIENPSQYQDGEEPPEKLVLQYVPFTQGMLYVGGRERLNDEQIQLVEDLAEAFSIAYARYEDFVHLEKAKGQVENTLDELKTTQAQLVHSEKMASLGELTAGIAHEIQNPLNFVNNFSEVNRELVEELLEEISDGNLDEVKAIAQDIGSNEEKIVHHGKRAEGIVKSMLHHSQGSSGEKEVVDLNGLIDEYVRLAYHGMRAKDKSFNAILTIELDDTLEKIPVIPQDIGRVLLNLTTNAFHTVIEKKDKEGDTYEPEVTVVTKKMEKQLEIRVKDNGEGMSNEVLEKIFQPFFTTKPTGEGTGLGLSLSYDIITKGHGGSINVESREGEGSEFIITLPTY